MTQQQRRFEWDLARDQQSRVAAQLVSGRTHDLLNLVQIVQLATFQLVSEGGTSESLDELASSATAARTSLRELMTMACPDPEIVAGGPVALAIDSALQSLRGAFTIDIRIDLAPAIATRCTSIELSHLVIGMMLDVADEAERIELHVRRRMIAGVPWVELVRTTASTPPGERFELRAVLAIAERTGGELATSSHHDGRFDLIVALPVVEIQA